MVEVRQRIEAEAGAVWAVLRRFCAPWHPDIARMHAEQGGQQRAFTLLGEDKVYRERLTWFSDTERCYRYTHVEGIEGVTRYDGTLRVDATGDGAAEVVMSAQIEAGGDRRAAIREGTEVIFARGLAGLRRLDFALPPDAEDQDAVGQDAAGEADQLGPSDQGVTDRTIGTAPAIALSTSGGEGPVACLFLHGIGGQRGNWDAQLGPMGRILPCAAMDLRGYGDSALGAAAATTIDAYCADILRVKEALGVEKLVLCGLSYGAWIATYFAINHPEHLAGLVLAGGCTGMSEADKTEREAFLQAREVPLNAGQTPADFAPGVVDVIAGPDASVAVRRALAASMAAIPAATYRAALRCFTDPPGRFDFARLTMPVLMMTGAHDRLAPPSEIHAVATRIHGAGGAPDVRFEVISGAGHVCNLEAPGRFNAPLGAFLRRFAP